MPTSGRFSVVAFIASLTVAAAVGLTVPPPGAAQTISLATGSPSVPPAPPPGPCAAAFSPDGDLFDPFALTAVPMGPPGCGLGWFGPPAPANTDAFSSGLAPFLGLPLPAPPGALSLLFSVDPLATGTKFGTCTTSAPGSNPPDVASEACGLDFGLNVNQQSTDAAGDLFLTSPNVTPLGGIPPAIGTMVNFQALDGDGIPPAFGCQFIPVGASGLAEPVAPSPGNDPFDDIDALDTAPVGAWDFVGPDGIPDVPVYYSVDAPTAAAAFVSGADVAVSLGGIAALYAPGPLLGLDGGGPNTDDIDGLVVLDLFLDGIYAPGLDTVLYSLSPTSATVGTPDGCLGIPIGEGDILVEGTPLGAPGLPCIFMHEGDFNLWDDAACGVNPVTGGLAGDNVDAFDLFPATAPPAPLCGPAPMPDGLCRLADPSGNGKSIIKIKRQVTSPDKGDKFSWKWSKGVGTATADFMNPVATTNTYRLCVYDASGSPQPLLQKDIIPGGINNDCSGSPCWKPISTKGFKYTNSSPRQSAGIFNFQLKEGDPGKAKVSIKAKEKFVTPPLPPLTLDVVVQLLIYDGINTECFKTTFPLLGVKKNTATDFIAKGP